MFKELFEKLSSASDEEESKSSIWSEFVKENITVSGLKKNFCNVPDNGSFCENDILSKLGKKIDSTLDIFEAFNEEDEQF